jgi:hypothetical protein
MTKDITIYETGSGGDIAIINNDIALSETLYQQAYLALFGGNVEADTLGNELPGQLRYDWWGNSVLFNTAPFSQFNSQTERALMNNALNSTGRINIQRAAQADLAYLSTIAVVTVAVTLLSVNKLQILINMIEPANQQNVQLQILWDNAKKEVIINKLI